jgi:ABC-type polysaccharide/polyol phosphate export permease
MRRTPSWYDTGVRELLSLWTHRRVLRSLAGHDLRKAYAGTAGGVAWSVVTPLVPILIFSAIFAYGFRLPLGNAPYVLAFAAAYVPWIFLSGSIAGAAGSLVDHRYLVKKVAFPIEIIPADPVLAHALPHGILLLLAAAACAMAGYGRFPDVLLVLYFFACGAVLALSAGLLVSAVTVVVRDLQQTLPSILHVWFWLTPIAWPADRLPPRARALLALNPANYVVSGYRHALLPRAFAAPSPLETAAFWLTAVATLLIGATCFRRLRADFWDCL